MFRANENQTKLQTVWLVAALATALIACGQSSPRGAADAADAAASHETVATQTVKGAPEESSIGSVAFAVNGEAKSFEYLPKSGCVYNPLASTVRALPEAGSTESFGINFMSVDLKKLGYPADLPLPKDPSRPMSAMAAMATIGFDYIDGNGNEWAGPASIHIDSFNNSGVIQGTFDKVTLRHTDEELPDITLSGGSFTARITPPW